jgi:hypothetical protein
LQPELRQILAANLHLSALIEALKTATRMKVPRLRTLLPRTGVPPVTKKFLFALFFVIATAARGQTYSNLNNSTAVDDGLAGAVGWGSCVACAGGNSDASTSTAPFQTTPSMDGSSRDFYINGAAGANGLWWYKVGPNDAVSNFEFDFWVYVSSSTSAAGAMEFDAFQFNKGVEYMFGTRCDYLLGTWDVWNMGAEAWVQTSVACTEFQPGIAYHLSWKFHRISPSNYESYDSLTIVSIQPFGRYSRVGTATYNFNLTFPSGPMPSGWTENMGVQFQMDIAGTGATMEEWVDEVTLTTH